MIGCGVARLLLVSTSCQCCYNCLVLVFEFEAHADRLGLCGLRTGLESLINLAFLSILEERVMINMEYLCQSFADFSVKDRLPCGKADQDAVAVLEQPFNKMHLGACMQ